MNTLHLTYAVEVERCGSITQAAENLYMAQPNLSKAIKELEDAMGFSIFSRTSRGVVPTERGREFLTCAKAILAELRKMEALNGGSDDRVQRVSLSVASCGYMLDCLCRLLDTLDRKKAVDIRVQSLEPRKAAGAVAEDRISLAALHLDDDPSASLTDPHLAWETLWEYDALATFSARHPLAEAERITVRDLAAYPQIGSCAAPPAPESLPGISIDGGRQQLELLAHFPAYLWSAPETPQTLKRYGLTQRACEGAPHYYDVLLYAADRPLSATEERFAALLRARRR